MKNPGSSEMFSLEMLQPLESGMLSFIKCEISIRLGKIIMDFI